jgi:hypothetical protein
LVKGRRGWDHKVHEYKEYHSVCPLVGIETLSPPLSLASLALCLLCVWENVYYIGVVMRKEIYEKGSAR